MQHVGLFSFIILVLGLTITAVQLPGGLRETFSQRVAGNKRNEILYSALFITTLPLLYIFFAQWLVPTYRLPHLFLVFAGVSALFQIACTWFPERGGKMTIIHRVLTSISGVALLPMVMFIAISQTISTEIRIIAWTGLIIMLILLGVALTKQDGFRYALLLQIGYYMLFFGVILLATYSY